MSWAETCIDFCGEPIDSALKTRLKQSLGKIWTFNPPHLVSQMAGNDEAEYRQTCNAAEALSFLNPRQNSRIPDRLAILANLCNYLVRFDTEKTDALGYDFSLSAFALAVLNGDFSLISTEAAAQSEPIAYCWGPWQHTRMQNLPYFEDQENVVRFAPAKLVTSGILIQGWLLRVDGGLPVLRSHDIMVNIDLPDVEGLVATIWRLIKELIHRSMFDLADTVWECTTINSLGATEKSIGRRKTPPIREIFDLSTGRMKYRQKGLVESEEDYTTFFNDETLTLIKADWNKQRWELRRWFWEPVIKERSLPAACLVNKNTDCWKESSSVGKTATAVFDVSSQAQSADEVYVFTPASVLDERHVLSARLHSAFSWIVRPPIPATDVETGCRVIQGLTRCCGHWKVPGGATPELFVLA